MSFALAKRLQSYRVGYDLSIDTLTYQYYRMYFTRSRTKFVIKQ